MGMNNRRRGGGRKKRAKLCLAKNANGGGNKTTSSCLEKKLGELQRSIPGSSGMEDMHTLFKGIENYILALEAKVTVLRCLSNFYGV